MLNDVEMLQSVRKTARMGCEGIDEILPMSGSEKFRKALETQKDEYKKICEEADRMLVLKKAEPEDLTAMAKMGSKTMTMMKTMKDNSDEHLAEMMYQGSAMGVTKIIRNLREFSGNDSDVRVLAERLLKTEENNMEQMKKFL
jgi:hypothetical protein